MKHKLFIPAAGAFIIILLSALSNSPSDNLFSQSKDNSRLLAKTNESLFVFWMGMSAWKDILSWLWVSARYISVICIIIGCLIQGDQTYFGWTRLVRYVSFIYGTTYFLWNLQENVQDGKNVKVVSYLSDRSDFKDLYDKYYEKSENFLFSFERFHIFKNIVASDKTTFALLMKLPELFDGRFYELVILIVVYFIAILTFGGLSPAKRWAFSHKMNAIRVTLYLALFPGLIGRAFWNQALYNFFRN